MKAKLLKKLRKQIVLLERNGLFKLDVDFIGGATYSSAWTNEKEARELRRKEILLYARQPKHEKIKRVIR